MGDTFTFAQASGLLWYASTSGIPPTALESLAIGALLWSGLSAPARSLAMAWRWPLIVLGLLALFEWVRVSVVGYRGDATNLVLWSLLAPVAVIAARRPPPAKVLAPVAPTAPSVLAPTTDGGRVQRRAAVNLAIAVGCVTFGLWLVLRLPGSPYNSSELFGTQRWPGIVLFAAALLWIGAGAYCVVAAAARSRAAALRLVPLLVAASMISLVALQLSVTQESLDDITGSTDLYRRLTVEQAWGPVWQVRAAQVSAPIAQGAERAVRFGALYGLLLIPLTAAIMLASKRWLKAHKLAGLAVLLACWYLAKLVVIDWAITDNLVELIADDGVPYLALLLVVIAACAAVLGLVQSGKKLLAAAVLAIPTLPLTWWLLQGGLEPVLLKYGIVSSAARFLLGQNRSALLSDGQLFARWCALYVAALIVIAWGIRLARNSLPAPAASPRP